MAVLYKPDGTILSDDQCVTATGAAAAAVTLTLPAVAGKYHYISHLRILRFAAALLTAAATPVIVTTTNMPGSLAFSIDASAAAQGTTWVISDDMGSVPWRSSASNTDTTVVAPATTNVIWRITAHYFTAL